MLKMVNFSSAKKCLGKALGVTLAGLALTVGQAQAAIVTVSGDDLTFTYDDSTLYGSAFVVGNNLFFSPTNFSSQSTNGAGVNLVNETLNIQISVNSGSDFIIENVGIRETGDYILNGSGSSVSASIRAQTTSLTMTNSQGPLTSVWMAQTGTISFPQDGSLNPWALSNTTNLWWDNETAINYQIQNNLIANTNYDGDFAFLQKKSGSIAVVVNEVPLPAAFWLFGSAIFGLVSMRHKARR